MHLLFKRSLEPTGSSIYNLGNNTMIAGIQKKFISEQHCFSFIDRGAPLCKYALFLGAGCSVTSGVKTASQMVSEWWIELHRLYGNDKAMIDFRQEYIWNNQPEEYGELFQELFPNKRQRRDYIERCIEGASSSWGYVYLANLIAEAYFNVVFTTNFDDLLNDAFIRQIPTVKPVICAHNSTISDIPWASTRPKIIKLHGDFLFDSLKNTGQETKEIQTNMAEKLEDTAKEQGLLVVGYGGNDSSVMNLLGELMEKDRFPHGILWCLLDEEQPSHGLKALLDKDEKNKIKLVRIAGFDPFFSKLHSHFGLALKGFLHDPVSTWSRDFERLLQFQGAFSNYCSEQIMTDIAKLKELQKQLTAFVDTANRKLDFEQVSGILFKMGEIELKVAIPYDAIAKSKYQDGKLQEAFNFARLATKHEPTAANFIYVLRLLRELKEYPEGLEQIAIILRGKLENLSDGYEAFNSVVVELINLEAFDLASDVVEKARMNYRRSGKIREYDEAAFEINAAQIRKHQGKALTGTMRKKMMELRKSKMPLVRLGAYVVLDNFSEAEESLRKLIQEGTLDHRLADWPIIKLLMPHLRDKSLIEALPDYSLVE